MAPIPRRWVGWALRKGRTNGTTSLGLYGYDALFWPSWPLPHYRGANTINRLRKQVAEAQQLGQYRIRKRIGSGGMGEVYLADRTSS